MASGALFGNTSRGTSSGRNLVEFRAGKMFMKGKMVHPDKRKGLVYVHQSDDSLMHFCWKDRTTGVVEDDLIIFPDDIEFKHVPACTTGRVYILKFKLSSRKFFFWLQEPKNDKDEEFCRKVNEFLNNPPTPGSTHGGGGSGGGLGGLPPELAGLSGDSDLQGILGNMSQQQLMQMLGGMGMGGLGGMSSLLGGRQSSAQSSDSTTPIRVQSSPGPRTTATTTSNTSTTSNTTTASSTPATTTTTTTTSDSTPSTTTTTPAPTTQRQSSIQLMDLQNILSNMNVPAESKENVDLSQAIPAETIIPLLANPETQQRLIQFLPEAETLPRDEKELRSTIQSPQFQQALSTFSSALASGQLGPLMQEFGMGEDVVTAAAAGDVQRFVKALEEEFKKKKEEK